MDIPLKIQSSLRKKKREKKYFQRKIKKLSTGWHITDQNCPIASRISRTSLHQQHKYGHQDYVMDDKEKQVDDIARKLLELTSNTSASYEKTPKGKNNDKSNNEASLNVVYSENEEMKQIEESLSNIGTEETVDMHFSSERTKNKSGSKKTCLEHDGPSSTASNCDSCEISEEIVQNDIVSSSELDTTEQLHNYKLLKKKKWYDSEAVVIEMKSNTKLPKHHLMSTVYNSECDSSPVPFQYKTVTSALQQHSSFLEGVQTLAENDRSSFIFYTLPNNKVLLGMKYLNTLYFRGKLSLLAVFGTVEVLGFEITGDGSDKCYTVYSPRSISLLGLQVNSQQPDSLDWNIIKNKLLSLGMDYCHVHDVLRNLNTMDCLLMVENFSCALVKFLSVHFPLKLFPSRGSTQKQQDWRFTQAEKLLQCNFFLPDTRQDVKLYTKRLEWTSCAEDVVMEAGNKDVVRAMIFGGKSVGKSTFLRFLINQSLLRYKEVLCLDFDPGQSEFTIPGCVSAVVIREPLLGPNFTHLLTPNRMVYVGDINVAQCPVRYLQCTEHIIKYCFSHPELCNMPCFINTMGFNKGLGVELMIHLIRMMDPSDVIQIQSISKKRNFPEPLDVSYVSQYQSTLHHIPSISSRSLNYKLHVLPSAAESELEGINSQWGLEANKMRDLVILSYLRQIVVPPNHSLTEIIPSMIPFAKLKLCVCHEVVQYSQYLSVFNGNLVALCSANEDDALIPNDPGYPQILTKPPICQCLGFGIVRGIDMEEKQLFLISPLSESEITQVNCLVLGPVSLPVSIRLNAEEINSHIPYVSAGKGQPTGRNLRRIRTVMKKPRKKKNCD